MIEKFQLILWSVKYAMLEKYDFFFFWLDLQAWVHGDICLILHVDQESLTLVWRTEYDLSTED